jgi:hypothetical protein
MRHQDLYKHKCNLEGLKVQFKEFARILGVMMLSGRQPLIKHTLFSVLTYIYVTFCHNILHTFVHKITVQQVHTLPVSYTLAP